MYPSKIVEVLGSTLISSISIYLGVHLFKTNIQQLIGEQQIDNESIQKIISIAMQNSLLKEISEVKAVKYQSFQNIFVNLKGSEKFRLSAKIEFDKNKLMQKVTSSMEYKLQQLKSNKTIYSHRNEDNYMKNAANLVMFALMKEFQVQINQIQDAIQNEYPNCEHIDLEISHQESSEDFILTELENKLMKYDIKQGNSDDQISQDFTEFVLTSATRLLKKHQENQLKKQGFQLFSKPLTDDKNYLQSEDHLSNQFEEDLLEEFAFQDDQRFEAFIEFLQNDLARAR